MREKRDIALDALRVVACCMVVVMHSPMPAESANGPFLTALSYLTAPCIGLFFMVSGALLLPVKGDYFTFIKRRFGKIAIPTVVWSLVYIGLRLYYSESELSLWRQVVSIPFSPQGEGVLWFMYTLAGLYLLAPVMSAWAEKAKKTEIELVLGLWGVTLCYPLISPWIAINESSTGVLYYFAGYAGYFLLGYYMKRFPGALPVWLTAAIAASGAVLLLCLKHRQIEYDFYTLFWYQSIFIAAFAAAIWRIVSKIAPAIGGGIGLCVSGLANLSFGVYLVHILVMRRWLWHMAPIRAIDSYVMQTLVIALITLAVSAAVCALISRLPGAQWLIGYRRRNRVSTT